MNFSERLNQYIKEFSCTGKEIAQNSGLSEAVISRYRKGERVPMADSEHLKKLSEGILKTAKQKGIEGLTEEDIFSHFLRHYYRSRRKDLFSMKNWISS